MLYPLRVLGFEVIALQDWRELPEKLLHLAEDLAANPGVRTRSGSAICQCMQRRPVADSLGLVSV